MKSAKSNSVSKIFPLLLSLVIAVGILTASASIAQDMHTSSPFAGVKANTGTVAHTKQGNKNVLTLSDDFVPPDTPDPHWQVVDSKGNVYLLDKLRVKGDRYLKSITLPAYIPDVAKVQIWCSFAEVLLGEASFSAPVK
ncbi:MAG: hypothetical protein LAO21_13435 [Acidobacteriia bacterium]|nr:hypothetical protein [Terriglobia bacterium]